MTDKACPMTFGFPQDAQEWKCVKEKCAWWIKRGVYHGIEGCAIKIFALRMDIFVQSRKALMKAMGKKP